ncbi:MAG: protein-disulfide reductase DsbD [Legionellaceae bacterium]|nr:protein-disulfide reductase DsbD [Legionellaceae bacterium]
MLKRFLFAALVLLPLISSADPLPVNKAFKISVKPIDPNTIQVKWNIAHQYFLYKDCLQILDTPDSNLHLGKINYPAANDKINRQGQHFSAYEKKLIITVPVLSEKPGENFLEVRYQGCSDQGFCYPPEKRWIKITTDTSLAITATNLEVNNPNQVIEQPKPIKELPPNTQPKDDQTDFKKLFSSNNWALIILSFFGFGLLLSFTPCVLPMVPVLSSIIVGHGHDISTKKAFFLSLSYVLSMSVTYGMIGAVIALLGSNLQVLMQSPWVISIFSLIFVLLSLSMFNVYELKLPISWQNNLAKVTRSQSGGHYLSAIILGSMSILILSPCVSAPLIGALSYIAQTGDITLGIFSLFFLSFGMGIPLLLIGTSAGKLLPKAGSWMNIVKAMFGVILLGVAIYLMSRLIPGAITMALWATLLIYTGVYLKPLSDGKTNQDKFKQGLAIIFIGYGLFILYGASSGNTNPLLPLENTQQPQTTSNFKTKTVIVNNLQETMEALESAQKNKTPVMLYFYADWCSSCHVIASTTLQEDVVLTELEHVLMIKVDITKNNTNTKALLNYFHVIAPPTFIFYDKNGNTLPYSQLVGEISTNTLLKQLKKL